MMTLDVEALPGGVGARIKPGPGADLSQLSPADQESLREAFASHSVLLLRGETLDSASLLALTRVLGETEIHPVESIRLPGQPEIIQIAHTPETIPAEGEPGGPDEMVGELTWHADLMYTPVPSRGALLVAREVPEEGGETAFIDMALAYEALDEATKRALDGRTAVYLFEGKLFRARSREVDEEQFSEVHHPLVRRIPGTEQFALSVSPAAIRIDGLSEAESERLLTRLNEHAIQERFQYVHRWKVGDLVVFNNTRTLHTALGHKRKYRRLLHRTTLKGQAEETRAS
jgi:taurine dioxygenase